MLAILDLFLPLKYRDFVDLEDGEVITNHRTYEIVPYQYDEDEYNEWMDDDCLVRDFCVQVYADIIIYSGELEDTGFEMGYDGVYRLRSATVTDIEEDLVDADLNVPATKDSPQRKYYEFLEENNIQLLAQLADSMELAA